MTDVPDGHRVEAVISVYPVGHSLPFAKPLRYRSTAIRSPFVRPRPKETNQVTIEPILLDHTFTAPIGVDVKGEIWHCVEMPGSAEFFGTKRAVRVDATVDGIALTSVGLMVTGTGGHMLSLNAKLRKKLGKDIGDTVTVHLERRLT